MDKNSSRVLIVDDLPVNRMILSSLLASHGVMSDQADGGYKCLELARKNDYDLILLDHRMPDLDGVDTLTELKEIFKDKGRSVPVICHTSDEGSKNINLYKAAGFADVLIKPIDPAELSDVIMTYLPAESTPVQLGEPAYTPIEDIPSAETGVEEDARDELDKLPLWLKIVPHIDLSAGINACGSAEDYVDALYIFRSSIDEKSDDIEKHLDREDWTMYRLGVHSLKSMSRLVGARDLANMAASLEELTDKGETDRIRQKTPELLTQYRQFKKRLDPLMDDKDIQNLMTEATDKVKESDSDHYVRDLSRHVLFVQTKLATPISNGGLLFAAPLHCTGSA
ncbi:MAG: response regulator [Lachnospiraceae bacterium]|nr:response regulator [Lachnospiraceae bacterium]